MADTTFIDGSGSINADWLNEINDYVYTSAPALDARVTALESAGSGAPTILDTPEELISSDTTRNVWTTINNTTLNTASATIAILRVQVTAVNSGSQTSILCDVGIKKTGTGNSSLGNEIVLSAGTSEDAGGSSSNLLAYNSVEVHVALDGSSDFDWFAGSTSSTTNFVTIYLAGYY